MTDLIKRAKEKLRIPELWRLRQWPGEPSRECFRPYAPDDRRKSGSVFEDGKLFKDFKSGKVMDAPGLLGEVEGLDNGAACKLFIELAGVKGEAGEWSRRRSPQYRPSPPRRLKEERKKPQLPALRMPEPDEVDVIAELRGLGPGGVEEAARRGLLWMAKWGGVESWAVADCSGWNCQFRRLDGRPFEHRGGPKKTLGIPGGWGSWPLGLGEVGGRGDVVLVEGTGDFLAAHHFGLVEGVMEKVGVLCVPGASVWLPGEALKELVGKRVRIFPHCDSNGAGEKAGVRWSVQLREAGVGHVECFSLAGLETAEGEAVEDLNDVALMSEGDRGELDNLIDF